MIPGITVGYDKEIQDGFIRQRRNLIAISLVLWFVETATLTFPKLNILGNEFPISNPAAVNHALWIAGAYWMLRYLQYLHHARGLLQIAQTWAEQMRSPTWDLALERVRQAYPEPKFSVSIDKDISHSLRQWVIRFVVDLRTSTGGIVPNKGILHEETLSFRDLFIPQIRAAWYLVFRARLITEYILPILLALIPVGFKIYKMYMSP